MPPGFVKRQMFAKTFPVSVQEGKMLFKKILTMVDSDGRSLSHSS